MTKKKTKTKKKLNNFRRKN